MNISELFYKDPADRFKEIAQAGAYRPVEADKGAVSPTAIEAVIEQARTDQEDISKAIGTHLALNTSLTKPAAERLVAAAAPAVSNGADATSDSATAKAVSRAVATAGFSGQVSLSDPAMLAPLPRLVAALLLVAIAFMSVIYDAQLSPTTGWGAYVALTIASVLSILGVLILVMGYKAVHISGSSAPPSSG